MTKRKLPHIAILIMAVLLLSGSYLGSWRLPDATAGAKTAPAKTEETGTDDKKMAAPKGKQQVLENDDLIVIGTEVDVSGKTFKQVKKEMHEEAAKNGGIIGE